MAGPDLSIFSQYLRPPKSVDDFTQEAQARESNKLQLLLQQGKLTDDQTAREEQRRLMDVMRGINPDATPSDRSQALRRAGFYGQADAADKADLANQKTRSDIGKTDAEAQNKKLEAYSKAGEVHRDALRFVNDPQSAAQWLAAGYNDPIVGEIVRRTGPLENALQKIPQDPAKFREWKLQAEAGIAKFIEVTKPVLGNRNLGGTYQDTATDPLTGEVKVMSTAPITQDANSIASNARQAADAAAGRSVQIRGQNLTDARSRESNANAMSKPFEVTGPDGLPVLVQQAKDGSIKPVVGYGPKPGSAKAMTEGQAKANLFGTRAQESDKILNSLAADGVERPGNIKSSAGSLPLVGGVAGTLTNWTQSDGQQQVEQAQRDFVNAVLRRESGAVISEPEFENARKQYFPQINDGEKVKAQKARNRQIAISGILAEVPANVRKTESTGGASGSFDAPKAGAVMRFDANGNPVK